VNASLGITTVSTESLAASQLRRLRAQGEFALLDVRDESAFAEGHLLDAVSVPLSSLEVNVDRLLPRRGVTVVVADGEHGDRATVAVKALRACGYERVVPLAGDAACWRREGLSVFTGTHVRSKAVAERRWGTTEIPTVDVAELERRHRAGETFVLVDTRTVAEVRDHRIPGSAVCPGPELIYRLSSLAAAPDTEIVVTCGGRTRGLVGAHSLIEARPPNPVAWLEDGINSWRLAGLPLEHGPVELPSQPGSDARAWGSAAAERLCTEAGIPTADSRALQRLRDERESRTLYLFDVRTREEYDAGHIADSRWVPGGQLVHALDAHAPVRGARIVLIDGPDGTRAGFTAVWLRRQGAGEVFVARDALTNEPLVRSSESTDRSWIPTAVGLLDPLELRAASDDGTAVVDLADSRTHAAGHVPGAWFAIRARLREERPALPPASRYVITCPTGALAALAVPELQELTSKPVTALAGGTAAWVSRGLPLETTINRRLTSPDELWGPDFDDEAQLRGFLDEFRRWCADIVGQIERGGGW
jgi:rhodanese-related sulfurtransferase